MQKLNLDNVYIRCVRLNEVSRFQMTFPQNCRLTISNKILKEFEPLPLTSPLKRRNDQEVHINKYLLSYLTTLYLRQKHNKIQHNPRLQHHHLIMICSVKPPKDFPKQIYDNFIKERLPIKQSKKLLQEYMSQSINQCQVQKINVSLQCQYFGTQITCPARSKNCTTHYQPFDLYNFLKLSLTSNNCVQKWRCPICKKRAYDLFVDDYLQSLIKLRGNIKEITFSKNAEPIFVERQNDIDQQLSEQNLRNENAQINNQTLHQQKIYKNDIVIDIQDDDKEGNQKGMAQEVATIIQKNIIQNNRSYTNKKVECVIQIFDSQQNLTQPYRQALKRNSQDRNDIHKQQAQKQIKKIPPLSQLQVDKLQGLLNKPKSNVSLFKNKISEKIIQNENIRTKLREVFLKDSMRQKQTLNQEKKTNNMRSNEYSQIQKSQSIQKATVSSGQIINILDVDIYEQQRSNKLKSIKQQQMILLKQAKKTLSKEPMTKSDQITFNLICRQIQKMKMK